MGDASSKSTANTLPQRFCVTESLLNCSTILFTLPFFKK